MKPQALLLSALLLIAGNAIQAKITLPSVISDNMVLQQQTEACIWGTAEPGRKVTIRTSWDKRHAISTNSDPETGKWITRVKTPSAGGPYEITISDGSAITLKNILIGEVWFCSGQSNMEMTMSGYGSQPVEGATECIVTANPSTPIRICNIKKHSSTTVLATSEGNWEEHTQSSVAKTSATAYFFAELLQRAIDIPVGIIVTSWGGSTIETWMSREVIEKEFPEFDLGHLDGTKKVTRPYQEACLLYNGQVAPLVPYTIKGMIWYQGEANRGRAEQYIRLQTAYVKMMRELFRVPDAPFYFVQIAPYPYDDASKTHNGYFNEAQQKSLEFIPKSGMAVTCDVGEYATIHPRKKREVGRRLAYLALKNDYGKTEIEAEAPTYKSVTFKEGKAYVEFKVGGFGLSPTGQDLSGFEIAGADKVFRPATARHSSKPGIVEVYCAEVADPVAVRYCFRNWCVGSLYNNFGVPAAPFRTDDWPLR